MTEQLGGAAFGSQYSADVDLDQGAPGYDYADWCFYLSSEP